MRRIALRRSAPALIFALVALAHPGLRSAGAAPLETYLDFDGQHLLDLPDHDALDLSGGALTLSAWIHPFGWGENDQGRIFDHGGGSSGNLGWTLHVTNKASRGFPASLRMRVNDDSSFDGLADRDSITLGVWQHVAVSLESGTLRFYVDGVLVSTRTGVPTPLPRAAPTRIGMRATDTNRGFDGAIDEVRIWNRALSQIEIQTRMGQNLAGNEPGLVAYYALDEGSGQTAFDAGPNAIDANLGTSTGPDSWDPLWVMDTPGNLAPVVDAGADETIILPIDSLQLMGSASDDGLPAGTLMLDWTTVGGPPDASFEDPGVPDPVASFPAVGTYLLRLTADDSELTASDDVQVVVESDLVLTSIVVSPGTATLAPGEDRLFSALGFDQLGGAFPVTPSWSATGGPVDPTGLYTAGVAIGTFSVTATDSSVSGPASVQITYVPPGPSVWPTAGWVSATPGEMAMDVSKLEQARDYALSGGGAGMITRGGKLVLEWGSRSSIYDVKSTTKSIGALLLGLLVDDGLVSLDDPAAQHLSGFGTPPSSNAATGWLDDVTLHELATQTAGFDKPGGFIAQLFEPGAAWAYTDGGVNWLADVLTSVHAQDMHGLLFDRILTTLGVAGSQLSWRDHSSRTTLLNGVPRREFSSGIGTDVDTLARVGFLILRDGQWDGVQLLSRSFVDRLRRVSLVSDGLPVQNDAQSRFGEAASHYGLLWWNNADGSISGLPLDAAWAWGAGDSLIVVIPSLDIVVSRAGSAWSGSRSPSYYQVLEPFLQPIAEAVNVPEPSKHVLLGSGLLGLALLARLRGAGLHRRRARIA
jgi:CubicO group peptidase (beta-lactamase class C family)